MNKVLIPYDGSEAANRALRFVIDQPPTSRPQQVHVLNVQAWPILYGEYAASADVGVMREPLVAHGRRVVDAAERLLLDSGIPFQSHVLLGDVAQSVVEQTAALNCSQIVMGTRGAGSLKGLVMGSVATKVVHLATVPVTLVK